MDVIAIKEVLKLTTAVNLQKNKSDDRVKACSHMGNFYKTRIDFFCVDADLKTHKNIKTIFKFK